jgi:hypothetical protein
VTRYCLNGQRAESIVQKLDILIIDIRVAAIIDEINFGCFGVIVAEDYLAAMPIVVKRIDCRAETSEFHVV